MSHLFINIAILLIAILHIGFGILEMFLWNKSLGRKIFKLEQVFADRSAALAANQGLYNFFLAAGLIWSVLPIAPTPAINISYFFLGCIAIAGIYGAATVSKRIFYIQAVPAILLILNIYLTN